jgi:Uma2 family endonuclease
MFVNGIIFRLSEDFQGVYNKYNSLTETKAMATVQAKIYTPADLLKMPDSNNIELVNGELVEKPVSALSALVETRTSTKLQNFCDTHKAGFVLSSTNGIQCFADDPNRVRKPDVSVYRTERFTRAHLLEGWVSIAPDLAVEVISTNDEFAEVTEKVEEYLAAGVPLVWIIDPVNELVYVHRKDGSVTKLHKTSDLSGEDVLPGFTCKVARLFPED